MVHSGLLNVLGMFFEKMMNANGNLSYLLPYLQSMVLEKLGIILLDMERVPCSELTDHKCYVGMI